MSRLLVAVCLVAAVVAEVPEKEIKDCQPGDIFREPGKNLARMCIKDSGADSGRSVYIGCVHNDEVVDFDDTFDNLPSKYIGYRFKCAMVNNFASVFPTHCLIGEDRKPVLPGKSGPLMKYNCTCSDQFGVTCK